MKNPTPYLKRFAAWATALTDNYRYNPFVQATVNIIVILAVLTILLIVISGWAVQYAQRNTVGSIQHHIQQAVQGTPDAASSLPEAIATVRSRTLMYVFAGLVGLITLFAFLLIRFALSPTKQSVLLQRKFIGNIAHELRTPLAIMKTSTEVSLMDPSIDPGIRETLLENIVELNRISEIINNLLSFDMFVRPNRMKTEPVDLGAIAEVVAQRHQALADSRHVRLTTTIRGHRYIMGNSSALEQIITNLVKNAINYTPADQNGHVQITIENDYQGRVEVSIIDNGIGISPKDLYRVFEPFFRGDSSRARGVGTGTSGLGLAIVNELVRIHHGRISLKSTEGEGTTVSISFPATKIPKEIADSLGLDESINEVSIDFS